MLYGPRESQVKDLTLAHCVQAKKAVPVPTCARYGLGDMGKAAKVRPSPGEAIVQHHEPFQLVFRRTSSAAGLRPTPSRVLGVLGVRLLKGRPTLACCRFRGHRDRVFREPEGEMQRRKFSREFKIEAVRLVRERGVSVGGVSGVDVHENVVRKWVKEFGADPKQAFPGHGSDEARAAGDRPAPA